MKKYLNKYGILIFFILTLSLFFYKTLFFQKVPLPGDLLLGNYEPYKSDTELGFAPGSIPNKGQGSDVIRQIYPWKYFSIESFKHGTFPLWDPYVFSGSPHFANLQSGTLYPVNILFFILPFVVAWSIYIMLQYFFALFFTYFYLRQIKLSKLAGIFGAVAFSYSAFFTVWGEYGNVGHSLSFLPLALFSIEKIRSSKNKIWYVVLAGSTAVSIFAGYIQLTLYIGILSLTYIFALMYVEKKDYKKYVLAVLSLMLGFCIAGVQLFPLYQLLVNSLRAKYSYKDLLQVRLMPVQNIITLLIPDFFGNPATRNYFLEGGSSLERASNVGILPIFFAVFAVFSKKNFYKIFFLTSALVSYVSCLAFPPVAFVHSIGIPFLSTGVPTRVLSVFIFSAAVLAAMGIDEFLDAKERKKFFVLIAVFLAGIFALWISTYLIHNPEMLVSRRNIYIPAAVLITGLIVLVFSKTKKAVFFIILLTLFELFYSFQKFNSFVPQSYIFPATKISSKLRQIQGIDRYWGYGNADIDANFQTYEKNFTTEGYDPLFPKRYGELLAASENGKIPQEIPRSVANIIHGYGVNDLKNNSFRKRALDLTGVKFILNKNENKGLDSAFSEKDFKLLWENNSWQIYTNKNVLPRIALFGSVLTVSGKKEIIPLLYSSTFDFHKTLILEKKLGREYDIKPDVKSSITNISYQNNKISLQTKASQDQILFISDNYFPGWKAIVDGKNTEILRADYTFRAIPLKKGTHTVIMYYSPHSFWIGLAVTFASITSLIVFLVSTKIKTA